VSFYDWVREEARLIHADGCSGVTNIDGICCLIHDLEFYYGKSATDAYRHSTGPGDAIAWQDADAIGFDEANANFRRCCFRESILGYANPLAWWRYWGVRTQKGRAAWDAHRARERQET